MSDMRPGRLLHGGNADHTVGTLSFRVAHMSPSSSSAGAWLSLLEGDCVGPTWPILKPGSHEPGFFSGSSCRALTSPAFFQDPLASLSRARLFSGSSCRPLASPAFFGYFPRDALALTVEQATRNISR